MFTLMMTIWIALYGGPGQMLKAAVQAQVERYAGAFEGGLSTEGPKSRWPPHWRRANVEQQPVEQEPINPEPVVKEPVNPEPINPEPVVPEPINPEPVVKEPVNPEPINPEPVVKEPVNPEPINPEPVVKEPVNPEPINPEPINPEPITQLPNNPPPADQTTVSLLAFAQYGVVQIEAEQAEVEPTLVVPFLDVQVGLDPTPPQPLLFGGTSAATNGGIRVVVRPAPGVRATVDRISGQVTLYDPMLNQTAILDTQRAQVTVSSPRVPEPRTVTLAALEQSGLIIVTYEPAPPTPRFIAVPALGVPNLLN
jgi:hypothetical protein